VTRLLRAQPDAHATDAKVRALPIAFPDDASLARAAAEGHPAAARCVWTRYSVLVRRLLIRSVGPTDADDLVQESFLRFFRLVHKLRDADKLRSFLVGITIRVAREELRRRRVRRWLSLSRDGNVPERGQTTDLDAAEALGRLHALLDRVDADTRLVFVLRHVEQMPTVELADVLGCSLATAKRRVKRATDRIELLARRDPALASFVEDPRSAEEPRDDDPQTGGQHG
jgi:RNA polymerase sigma-70 factor (ECF subfamily)